MKARAMPISSRTAEERLAACFCANSPRMREERSATDWQTLASSADSWGSAGCIAHDAIGAERTLQAGRVVEGMQMGYRLAHREEGLVRIERPPEEKAEQLAGAAFLAFQGLDDFFEMRLVMRFERGHAVMRAPEGLAVRGQHQHVLRQLAVLLQRLEEQAQRIALGVDRPDADVGRDGGEQHVAGDDDVQRLAVEREVLGRVAMANEGAPLVAADLHPIALDDPSVR